MISINSKDDTYIYLIHFMNENKTININKIFLNMTNNTIIVVFRFNLCIEYPRGESEILNSTNHKYLSFRKSWFFGMHQFSFNPAGIFSLKDTLKIYKGKKIRKIRKPSAGFIIESPLYHWIPRGFKFPLILICLRVNDTFLRLDF